MNKKNIEALAIGSVGLVSGLGAYLSRSHDLLDLQSLGCVVKANAEHLLSGLTLPTIGAAIGTYLDQTPSKKEQNFFQMIGYVLGCIASVTPDLMWEKISGNVRSYYQFDQIACDVIGASLPLLYFALKNKSKGLETEVSE